MFLSKIFRGDGGESRPVLYYDFDRPFEPETERAPFTEEGAAPEGNRADPAGSVYSGGSGRPYLVEGIGEDFLPRNVDFSVVDHFEKVTDKDAAVMTRRIAREEGIFAGMSSGAALAAAAQLAPPSPEPMITASNWPSPGGAAFATGSEFQSRAPAATVPTSVLMNSRRFSSLSRMVHSYFSDSPRSLP